MAVPGSVIVTSVGIEQRGDLQLSEEFRRDYPIREGGFLKQLGGFDIYRSSNLIMAIVAVEAERGTRDIRFYRWQLRRDARSGQEAWKVDLARFSVGRFDFKDIAEKVQRLNQQFRDAQSKAESAPSRVIT